ncbi:MAG: hypothetical protein GF320_15275 [Armatimonadia bacterium]|nr:hypothetical protein [Armatimonadia bacterium]
MNPASGEDDSATNTYRIATFNLQNLEKPRKPSPAHFDEDAWRLAVQAYDRHLEAVRGTLTRIRADVLAVQEVMDEGDFESLIGGTEYAQFARSPIDRSPGIERQQVILSRYDIRQVELHRQETRVSWVHANKGVAQAVHWNRPIVEVTVDLPSIGPTAFLALHLKSKRPSDVQHLGRGHGGTWPSLAAHAEGMVLSSLKRVGQALELRRRVDELFRTHHSARIVVMGDFNDSLDSVPLDVVRGNYVGARNPELWDQELYPVELSLPREKQYTLIHSGTPVMIDHILISRALLEYFESATILNETIRDHLAIHPHGAYFPDSDHAPVVMELTARA